MSAYVPLSERSDEWLIERLGQITFENPESAQVKALLESRAARAQAAAAQGLVVSTDRLVGSTRRLSCATWALVAVTLLLALAAGLQAWATLMAAK